MSGSVGRVSFGAYVLDERSRELLRGPRRAPVHLTGKGIDTLLLLVAERPRALSKQEILDRVWPDCFVADATLASVIAELRRAFGESGRKASYVRTCTGSVAVESQSD